MDVERVSLYQLRPGDDEHDAIIAVVEWVVSHPPEVSLHDALHHVLPIVNPPAAPGPIMFRIADKLAARNPAEEYNPDPLLTAEEAEELRVQTIGYVKAHAGSYDTAERQPGYEQFYAVAMGIDAAQLSRS
jgi:hypothetical protein